MSDKNFQFAPKNHYWFFFLQTLPSTTAFRLEYVLFYQFYTKITTFFNQEKFDMAPLLYIDVKTFGGNWRENGMKTSKWHQNVKIIILTSCTRGAWWLSGSVSDSGARGRGFETYRRRVVSLSKTLYSPKVLVNYPGSGGPSRHDWKIVDWDVKPQHKQTRHHAQESSYTPHVRRHFLAWSGSRKSRSGMQELFNVHGCLITFFHLQFE